MLEGRRIGFVGAGAMAEALAGGLLAAGVARERLLASDVDGARRRAFEARLGIATTDANAEVVRRSDAVVVAVKPGAVPALLASLRRAAGSEVGRVLWISIAAGVPLAVLERGLAARARIVRAMPNTPALLRAGATGFFGNAATTAEDRAVARALFEGVGIAWEASSEALLDAVTGLSGSGPAYLFAFLEALIEAGAAVGLPREAAERLAKQTVFGAARLALESERSPAELRQQVSSPGGTTLAGLARLEALGFARAVREAVAAATRRSGELGDAARDAASGGASSAES
jgi:pyrroline-5-carboxylate reductase